MLKTQQEAALSIRKEKYLKSTNMNKRNFLKSVGLGSLAIIQPSIPTLALKAESTSQPTGAAKHRVWINPNEKDTVADLQKLYASYKKAGIGDIFFEADSEK